MHGKTLRCGSFTDRLARERRVLRKATPGWRSPSMVYPGFVIWLVAMAF